MFALAYPHGIMFLGTRNIPDLRVTSLLGNIEPALFA